MFLLTCKSTLCLCMYDVALSTTALLRLLLSVSNTTMLAFGRAHHSQLMQSYWQESLSLCLSMFLLTCKSTLCLCVCVAALSTTSPLRALVSVSNTTMLPPGMAQPVLQGQTQASAMKNGTISIADLSLLAKPGIYSISVVLPDYPQVGFESACRVAGYF